MHLFCRTCLLDHDCAHSLGRCASRLASRAVELLQGFTLHLQLHLRVLFHDLRVTLAQRLRYPFIRYSSCTQPCGIKGSQVVDAEIGYFARRSVLRQTVLKGAWYPVGLRPLGKRNGLSGVIAIWRRNASAAKGVRGTCAAGVNGENELRGQRKSHVKSH